MKRPALLVGALVATGLTVAPAPLSGAEVAVGDDWTITVRVPGTSWNRELFPNFTTSPCHELDFAVDVSGPAVTDTTAWSLSVDLRPRGAAAATAAFTVDDAGPGTFAVPGITICDDFKAPDAHPEGLYDVTGEASVPGSTDPVRPFATTFIVDPIGTFVGMMRYDNSTGATVVTGTVFESQFTADGSIFQRPVTGGSVVLQQLVDGRWTWIANGVWVGNGTFSGSAGTILPIGTYVRFVYYGESSVSGCAGFQIQLEPPVASIGPSPSPSPSPPALPIPTVKIKAVSGRSKLKVDVNPNRGSKFYVFQVQRKNADGSWKPVKSYETRGAKETRTLNLRKGTYRVWVRPGYGFAEAYSPNEVTLKR